MFAYCMNNPVNYADFFGMWCICLTQRVRSSHKCSSAVEDDAVIITTIDPSTPPDHPDYKPPKKWDGKKKRNPNSPGWGWPAKDGGVWVPTPKMHGGEGWTIQYPNGEHNHAYPGGKVRNHFQREQSLGNSIVMMLAGGILTGLFIVDDITGIGTVDDPLLAGSTACFVGGLNGILGKKVCTICGEVKYGY